MHCINSLSSDQSTLHCNTLIHWITFHFQSRCTVLPVFPQINPHCTALLHSTVYYCTFTFLQNAQYCLRSSNQSAVILSRCHIIVNTTPLLNRITDRFTQKTANTLQLATPSINQHCRHRFQSTLMQIHPLDECLCTLKWHKVAKI